MFKKELDSAVKASDFSTIEEGFLDFILSRQAMLCTQRTVEFYRFSLRKFISWMGEDGAYPVNSISPKIIRGYLSSMFERKLSDSYINGHARAIRAFMNFLEQEEYITRAPKFSMPTISKKQLPVLNSEELHTVLNACEICRDTALVLLLADTGVRRKELCDLNWGDVHLENGLVNILEGKGGKARSVVVGIKTRRALLKYRRTIDHEAQKPLFQTEHGNRFSFPGLRSCLLRISERAGVHVSPHILRRTFATLSLRSGMNPLHLQGLLGHSSLEMTRRYVSMVDTDLLEAHKAYGPVDNL